MSVGTQSVEHQWRKLGVDTLTSATADQLKAKYDEGYAQGQQAASLASANQNQATQQKAEELCRALVESTRSARAQTTAEVIEIVQVLFAEMLDVQLFQSEQNFQRAVQIVRDNLTGDDDEKIKVHLHPSHWPMVAEFYGADDTVELVQDSTVASGAVRVGNQFELAEADILHSVARLLSQLDQPTEADVQIETATNLAKENP